MKEAYSIFGNEMRMRFKKKNLYSKYQQIFILKPELITPDKKAKK
jgi:prolyl-tRNA synthetase